MDKILTNLQFFDFNRSKKKMNIQKKVIVVIKIIIKKMLRTAKNLSYSFICGPPTIFLQMKLTLRPVQQFEFDML